MSNRTPNCYCDCCVTGYYEHCWTKKGMKGFIIKKALIDGDKITIVK